MILFVSSSQAFVVPLPRTDITTSVATLPSSSSSSTTTTTSSSTSLEISSKATAPYSSASASSASSSTKSSSSSFKSFYTVHSVRGGEDDPRVVDIATFRNDMINPQAMVERAQQKRDSLDTTKVAIDGLQVGLFQVGPAIALATFYTAPETTSQDTAMMESAINYGKTIDRHFEIATSPLSPLW
jgi:hypothetical protein